MDVTMLRAPMPILNALNHVGCLLSKAPCVILAKPLNITLIATDNILGDLSDTRLGDMKAIIANTIATVPKPMFVKGVTFLLRLDGLIVVVFVFGKAEYSVSNIIPVATLSIPIVNKVIERSKIMVFTVRTEYSTAIKRRMDNVSDIIPLAICKARNHAGGRRLVMVDVIDLIYRGS